MYLHHVVLQWRRIWQVEINPDVVVDSAVDWRRVESAADGEVAADREVSGEDDVIALMRDL